MGRFTKIPQNAFAALQMDAGVLLNTFDPTDPEISDSAIITATTGGITVTCEPTYSDFAEDVDNAPNNLKEFKHLDGWNCTIETTALGTSQELIRWSLGAADVDVVTGAIKPRRDLDQEDFADLWWVGDRADGGFVAIKLINALSTAGFTLTTTKNGKGNIGITLTGHVSLSNQETMPMEFYSVDPDDPSVSYTYTAVTPAGSENPSEEGWYVLVGDVYRLTGDTSVDSNVTYYERTEG